MMRSLIFAILMTISPCGVSARDDSAVRAAVLEFADAFRSGDVAAVEAALAESYLHVNGGGEPLRRNAWLAWYRGFAEEITSGAHRFDQYAINDLEFALHDDFAYVTGVVEAKGVRNNQPFSQSIRFTNLWMLMNGKWRRAGFHDVAASKQDE